MDISIILVPAILTGTMAIWALYTILFDRTPRDLSGPVSGWGTLGDWQDEHQRKAGDDTGV